MSKLIMDRRAYDNKYLHRDFHASIDNAIAYIGDTFGEQAVNDYIKQYVISRYSKMTLCELDKYFHEIYKAEEAESSIKTVLLPNKLSVSISHCPGLDYLNSHGGASKWYYKTTSELYSALAEHCGYVFELYEYDRNIGKTEFAFISVKGAEK